MQAKHVLTLHHRFTLLASTHTLTHKYTLCTWTHLIHSFDTLPADSHLHTCFLRQASQQPFFVFIERDTACSLCLFWFVFLCFQVHREHHHISELLFALIRWYCTAQNLVVFKCGDRTICLVSNHQLPVIISSGPAPRQMFLSLDAHFRSLSQHLADQGSRNERLDRENRNEFDS